MGQLEGLPRHAWHPWNVSKSSFRSAAHSGKLTLLHSCFSLPCNTCLKTTLLCVHRSIVSRIACSSIRYHGLFSRRVCWFCHCRLVVAR